MGCGLHRLVLGVRGLLQGLLCDGVGPRGGFDCAVGDRLRIRPDRFNGSTLGRVVNFQGSQRGIPLRFNGIAQAFECGDRCRGGARCFSGGLCGGSFGLLRRFPGCPCRRLQCNDALLRRVGLSCRRDDLVRAVDDVHKLADFRIAGKRILVQGRPFDV